MGMSAPYGGIDPKAENQQLLFSDGALVILLSERVLSSR